MLRTFKKCSSGWREVSGLLPGLFLCCGALADNPDEQLTGHIWGLVAIQSMDDTVLKPASSDQFTLEFGVDGSVSGAVDCNRGSGSYSSGSPGQLQFGPLATTRAFCGPESIDGPYLSNLGYVRSYVFREGRLFLATEADGSIMEFRALGEDSRQVAPSFDCAKARSQVERAICSSYALAQLDLKLNGLYEKALGTFPAEELPTLKASQRGWIKGRDECSKAGNLTDCVTFEYESRITELQINTGSQMVPSPELYDCDDGNVLTVYFYPDTQLPSAVFNQDQNQVIALASTAGDGSKSYTAANFSFVQEGDTAHLTMLEGASVCVSRQ